jgi:hypothetical protein
LPSFSISSWSFSFDGRYAKDAIYKKVERLGLEVVDEEVHNLSTTTSNIELPEEMPSIKEALKILCAALKALETPGLDRGEVLRLRSIISGVKTYKDLLVDYVDYRGLERLLIELREKYDALAASTKS